MCHWQGSSVRILLPASRPQFAPPIWERRELRSQLHALGAGSVLLEVLFQIPCGLPSSYGCSLRAALGVPCRTTTQRAAQKMGEKAPIGAIL